MAVVTGTMENLGLTALANGIKNAASLTLQAWGLNVDNLTIPVLLDSVVPTFANDGGIPGKIDLSSAVEFELTSIEQATVTVVRLYSSTDLLASANLTTDNSFPAGGKLIVSNYAITVS